MDSSTFSTKARFNHASHAKKSPATCLQCHEAISKTDGDLLPAPSKKSCASCHDGNRVFSVFEASCTRCHGPSTSRVVRTTIAVTFDHDRHRQPCSKCHRAKSGQRTSFVNNVHLVCAGCHGDEYESREPVICATCHVGSEPWRKLHVEPRPVRGEKAFAILFDHSSHGVGAEQCRSCHTSTGTSSRSATHGACSSSGCHEAKLGPNPRLGDCVSCHSADLRRQRVAARSKREWSVHRAFAHEQHRTDPRNNKPLPCVSCHIRATRRSQALHPSKTTCAACHDGDTAFSVTGHGCRRCHRGR